MTLELVTTRWQPLQLRATRSSTWEGICPRYNADGMVELCCVAGSGRPAAHAVLQLAEHLQPTARDPATRASLTQALEALLERVNAQIATYERLAFLAVAKDRWTVENGLLTPSLKIKRGAIEKRYAPALDGWYASGRKAIWEE